MLLNFGDQTRTGAFSMVWTLRHIDKAFYIAGMWQKGYRRWEITLRDDKG